MGDTPSSLVRDEEATWQKPHSLRVDDALRTRSLALLDNFKPRLFYCYVPTKLQEQPSRHYFITDSVQLIEFHHYFVSTNQVDAAVAVLPDTYKGKEVRTLKEFDYTLEVKARMAQVCGARGHSFCLRNSEHLAKYVMTGSWVSAAVFPEGYLMQIFGAHLGDRERMLLNTPPEELRRSGMLIQPVYADGAQFLRFQGLRTVLSELEAERAYNVLVLGPTGSGKSNLVNMCYNKTVCCSCSSANSVTRHMEITHGIGWIYGQQERPVHIVDSIGFCDSELSPAEVLKLIKNTVKSTFVHIDRVVMVCSGRLEKTQEQAMKRIMAWLQYDKHVFNFSFVYSKADSLTDEEKEQNLATVCNRLGAHIHTLKVDPQLAPSARLRKPGTRAVNAVDLAVAVGFPPSVSYSEVEEDHHRLMDVMFTPAITRIRVDESTCSLL
eukprot:TRINITY_DN45727_c0_g1_i1.p1 TRINITY_DN45727_c0_g1~~TRINITY_DN45727_c0_g1_i1.p1  ORF type:complete len:437 (-),score=55.83 TRINITY_DN45727_c0_g1_i1:136-1446(-)